MHEDFDIEIFAAEPHVLDPVEMVFDEQGHAYVMEMADYPFKPSLEDSSYLPYHPEAARAGGRIRLLRDTNGDGRVDESTIYADSISEGTSILPWKGGLLVTSAPDILYLKDTTGDYRADTREVLFTGFYENNFQAQITSLRFSVDNWIYASNDGRPGRVRFNRNPDAEPVTLRGTDFRFRLDRGQFEPATGVGRVGRTINDWGHRFLTHSTVHIRQAVIPHRYLIRHAYLPSPDAIENINDHGLRMNQLTSAPYWRAERSARRQRQFDERGLDGIEHPDGYFSGASGGTAYIGGAFPEQYHGNIFTGEHLGNLVHRDVLNLPQGEVTYTASRDETEQDREFLASTDPWFRPSTMTVGPDGYLYVVDMYRQHTEHPDSVPEDLKEDMDYTRGLEHGRIYRIVPKNDNAAARKSADPNLREIQPRQWVNLLSHPNQWWRLQAQRLLVEAQDASVIAAVEKVLTYHEDPRARLHALYVLEGLNALNAGLVDRAMQDDHPGVREHGMFLSEAYPELLPRLIDGIDDPSARVALQASLSVGEFTGSPVVSALAHVVERHGQDAWFRTAVLSSETGSSVALMEALLRRESFSGEVESWKQTFVEDLSYAIGARTPGSGLITFLDILLQTDLENGRQWQVSATEGVVRGLKTHEDSDPRVNEALHRLDEVITEENSPEALRTLRTLYSEVH